jgi:DNA uptake protein ComE-like DNA-binding protein
MLERISEAEQRARDAEVRARAAVERIEGSQSAATAAAAAVPAEPAEEPKPEKPKRSKKSKKSEPAPEPVGSGEQVNLRTASFEQLRSLGMSVTQAGRVLAHRERTGFTSVDELDSIPGFPPGFLDEIRPRLTA